MTAAQLKTYFETGDKPTQAQFAALIDFISANGIVSVATFAAMEALAVGTAPIEFLVLADETNENQKTRYLWDGTNIQWVITQVI